MLLVLDNCEHLVAACAALADSLLRDCPQLFILATTRDALRLSGETTWQVPSLAFPDPESFAQLSGDAVAALMEYEAVQLLVARTRAALPTFRLTERDAPAVANVCRRLDGIRLALELAAARVRGLGVDQLTQRLDDRLRALYPWQSHPTSR
jgi:predicted ATPase